MFKALSDLNHVEVSVVGFFSIFCVILFFCVLETNESPFCSLLEEHDAVNKVDVSFISSAIFLWLRVES